MQMDGKEDIKRGGTDVDIPPVASEVEIQGRWTGATTAYPRAFSDF